MQEGVLHFRVYKRSTDKEIFKAFIKELLLYCGKWPEPRSVLVMDNALFYHSNKIERMCDDIRIALLFLPPYSPDLNPIKEFFEN
jgi:transposase